MPIEVPSIAPDNSEPEAVTMLRQKFADPSVQESLNGFSKTIQFSFTDIKEDYLFTIKDGKLASVERRLNPNANMVVFAANSLMAGILEKTANPMTAYMSGKLKIKGAMDDLMRLQKLMG